MENDPSELPSLASCSLFFPPLPFFSLSSLSLALSVSLSHTPSRKNPIIEISGPCWKRDSLWNVFGVTQRQCLSCPSANRMLRAGERHEIRTERETLRKKRKEKKGNPRRQRTAFAVRKKTAMRQVIRRWSDPAEAEEESSSTVTVSAE